MIFRNIMFLLGFFAVLLSAAGDAQARAKSHPFSWLTDKPDAWEQAKNFQPYLENGKHPHPSQWADQDWYAEDWISQRNSGLSLVQGFYSAGIIKDQDTDSGMPVLVVGPNFYHLSGYDKRRVVHTVDVVYGVTRTNRNAVIVLKDWHTKRRIGVFNDQGLALQ